MNLYDMQNCSGDIVESMAIPRGPDGVADLPNLDWAETRAVLRGMTFGRVKLHNVAVRPILVECRIEHSTFSRLRAHAQFWGAGNRWLHCKFNNIELQEVISPQTRFEDCVFQNASLVNYCPFETVFLRCTFIDTRFVGVKTEAVTRHPKDPELRPDMNVIFLDCTLSHCSFESCYFSRMEFRNTSFADTTAQHCDFSGIVADQQWWSESMEGDPFYPFLDEILLMIKTRLGENSVAHKAMREYVDDFKAGRTRSRDFSECLFDGRVSLSDLDEIEDPLDAIMAKYPF